MNEVIHKIKIYEVFADAVVDKRKTFEVRFNDRGYNAGDFVQFECIDKYQLSMYHKINDKLYKITYVLNYKGIEPNYVVFSFVEVDKDNA